MGVASVGIHYDGIELGAGQFSGARVLILDLHLLSGLPSSDEKQHYAVLAGILEKCMHEHGGPFIIILWTQHAHHAPELVKYLEQNISARHALPLAVIPMDKTPFLTATGAQAAEKLRVALDENINGSPQLKALLSWEADVHHAGSRTLAALFRLLPNDVKSIDELSKRLEELLARLAAAAVGKKNVRGNVRDSISSILAPILSDRIQALRNTSGHKVWEEAVTIDLEKIPKVDSLQSAAINRMLHIESPTAALSSDWGSVVEICKDFLDDKHDEKVFGEQVESIAKRCLEILEKEDKTTFTPVLIRVGAPCDAAQAKTLMVPYVLGVEAKYSNSKIEKLRKRSDSVWMSPGLDTGSGQFHLSAFLNFPVMLTPSVTDKWAVRYRLREQILMELIADLARRSSRPGITRID